MREAAAARGRRRAGIDRLQLQPLRELAAFLPLPARWRADLARFAPRGTVTQGHARWEGSADAPAAFAAGAEFANLGLVAQDAIPGATGLTGSFNATEKGGEVKLATRGAALELPRVFAGPIPFDTLQGALRWDRVGDRPGRHPAPRVHECTDRRPCQRHLSDRGAWTGEIDVTAQLRAPTRARCTGTCRSPRTKPRATGSGVR
jgi:hypothetical protein